MLRLAFDFIITWRETRTRPNAYNHYHFRKVEYMLILQGRMHATFQKYDDSEAVIEEIWEKGDLVRTLPGCVHTLTALGESNVLTIEFSPQPYVARDVLMNDKK